MTKYLLALLAAILLGPPLWAQSGVSGNLNAQTTDCTVTNACIAVVIPPNTGGGTISLAGTFSATSQFEVSADPRSTAMAARHWSALLATPSGTATAVSSATAAGAWQVNLSAYTAIRIRVSTFVSGTVIAAINLSPVAARGGGGGAGGTPGGSTTQLQFNDASAFNGSSLLTWDKTNSSFSAGTSTTPFSWLGGIVGPTTSNTTKTVFKSFVNNPLTTSYINAGFAYNTNEPVAGVFAGDFNGASANLGGSGLFVASRAAPGANVTSSNGADGELIYALSDVSASGSSVAGNSGLGIEMDNLGGGAHNINAIALFSPQIDSAYTGINAGLYIQSMTAGSARGGAGSTTAGANRSIWIENSGTTAGNLNWGLYDLGGRNFFSGGAAITPNAAHTFSSAGGTAAAFSGGTAVVQMDNDGSTYNMVFTDSGSATNWGSLLYAPGTPNILQFKMFTAGSQQYFQLKDNDTVAFLNNARTQMTIDALGNVVNTAGETATVYNNSSGHMFESSTAPTVSSGFGSGASVTASNGTAAFRVNVGTSNTGNGIIALPAATTGWNCFANDVTTTSTTVSQTKQVAVASTTLVTLQNYTDISGTGAWSDSDVLAVSCFAY